MVLMHNAPPTINLSETHGQSKFQLFPLALRVDVNASSYCRGESHVLPHSNLHIVKITPDGFSAREKNISQVAI
jgi:hypothetical protein